MSPASRPLQDLLRLCTEESSAEGWEELIRITHPLLGGTIRRTCLRYGLKPEEVLDDLLQEVYLKISANRGEVLRQFLHEAEALYPYLKVVAVNQVTDYCRSREAARRRASRTVALPADDTGPAVAAQARDVEGSLLLEDIDRILAKRLPEASAKRDRSVFWLYYQQGLTASAIAALPGVELSTKGVETLIHRLSRVVRIEIAGAAPRGIPEGKSAASAFKREGAG